MGVRRKREKETLVRERRTREEEGETWARKEKTNGRERKGKEPQIFLNKHSQYRGPRFDPWSGIPHDTTKDAAYHNQDQKSATEI